MKNWNTINTIGIIVFSVLLAICIGILSWNIWPRCLTPKTSENVGTFVVIDSEK